MTIRPMTALALTAMLIFGTSAASAQAQFTMKLSTSTTNDATSGWLYAFKKNIEARSGGRIKAEVYPASQLGSIARTIEGVSMGTIEVSMNASGFFEGIEPRFAVFSAPGLVDGFDHGHAMMLDPAVRSRLDTFGTSKGLQTLGVIVQSTYSIVSHKPIVKLEDFKGQKIRIPGSPIMLETMKRLGALPLSMPLGEVLPAFQNKTIDSVYSGPVQFTAFKYFDISKNQTIVPSSYAMSVAMINKNFLKSLGPELEKMVFEEARKADAAMLEFAKKDVLDSYAVWEKNGGKVVEFSASDAGKYNQEALAAAMPILNANPTAKEDFQVFDAASKKYRLKK